NLPVNNMQPNVYQQQANLMFPTNGYGYQSADYGQMQAHQQVYYNNPGNSCGSAMRYSATPSAMSAYSNNPAQMNFQNPPAYSSNWNTPSNSYPANGYNNSNAFTNNTM